MFLSVRACVISRTEYTELLLTGRSLNVREKGKGGGLDIVFLAHLKGTFLSKGKKHNIRPTEHAVHVVFFTAAGCNNSRRTAWVFIYTLISSFVVQPQG